jgi:hypothetical protein
MLIVRLQKTGCSPTLEQRVGITGIPKQRSLRQTETMQPASQHISDVLLDGLPKHEESNTTS